MQGEAAEFIAGLMTGDRLKAAATLADNVRMVPTLSLVVTVFNQATTVLESQQLNEAMRRPVDLACLRRAAALHARASEWLAVYIERATQAAAGIPAAALPTTVR